MHKFTDLKLWVLAGMFTPVWAFVNKYLWNDWEFLRWLSILLVLDLFSGVVKSWMKKVHIVSHGLRLTVIKIVQYGGFLIVIHVLENFTIKGETVAVYSWMTVPAYTLLMGIEAKSIFENLQELNRKFKLEDFIERIKDTIKLGNNGS
jgi:phage-related holin